MPWYEVLMMLRSVASHRKALRVRDRAFRSLRAFLHEQHFIEVDTPTFHPPSARLISTCFSLGSPQHPFRAGVAPHDHLKQLAVRAGFDRLFEIRHRLRPDLPSRDHQPEYCVLELCLRTQFPSGAITFIEHLVKSVLHDLSEGMPNTRAEHLRRVVSYSWDVFLLCNAPAAMAPWVSLGDTPRPQLQDNRAGDEPRMAPRADRHLLENLPTNQGCPSTAPYFLYNQKQHELELFYTPQLELLNLFKIAEESNGLAWVGCAVGVDRLLMAVMQLPIDEVVAFPWPD